jgi:hypothetical protein
MEYYIRMTPKNIYYPPTTPQQRKLLFETWEQTGNVTTSCQKAHVGRTTFYLWKPRFDKDVNSRPMCTGHSRLDVYHQKE